MTSWRDIGIAVCAVIVLTLVTLPPPDASLVDEATRPPEPEREP